MVIILTLVLSFLSVNSQSCAATNPEPGCPDGCVLAEYAPNDWRCDCCPDEGHGCFD